MVNKIPSFTKDELKWISKVVEIKGCTNFSVRKESPIEFDIHIEGKGELCLFSAWLPLSIISESDWTDDKIWSLTDAYGELGLIPEQSYDWSGIRDSSRIQIYKMLNVVLKEE